MVPGSNPGGPTTPTPARPPVVSLLEPPEGRGPLWGAASADLNATLLAWGADEQTPEHVNDERDVLLVVVAGSGVLRLDGEEHELQPLGAVLVEKGRRRQVVAGPAGVRYLTVHLARGGLRVVRKRRGPTGS